MICDFHIERKQQQNRKKEKEYLYTWKIDVWRGKWDEEKNARNCEME